MQRIAMLFSLALVVLLAACGGGPPKRFFPPELSIQELRTPADGQWTVVFRLRNYSTMPVRYNEVRGRLRLGEETLEILADPGLLLPPNSVDPFEVAITPSAALRERVATIVEKRYSLRYEFTGSVNASEPSRRFEISYKSFLSPVPGIDGVLR